ncbi:MAG: tyrosine-type recombinase/integrase [Victivallaceae bacterium]
MKKMHLMTDMVGKPPKPFKRGRVYYIRLHIGQIDTWRSLRTGDRREAEYLAYEIWRAQQRANVRDIIPAYAPPMGAIWSGYTGTQSYAALAPSTRETRKRNWMAFDAWAEAHRVRAIDQLRPDVCEKYLESRGKTNKTFNNVLADLRTVLHGAGVDPCVFDDIKPRSITRGDRVSTHFKAFTDAEIDQLRARIASSKLRARDEWLLAMDIALNTALRFKDVALLRWDSLCADERGHYLEVVPYKTAAKTGGKAVYIRLIPVFASRLMIRRQQINGEYVLPELAMHYARHGMNSTRPFMTICAELGNGGGFHCLRTTVITKAAKAGFDLGSLGGVVGHTTKRQTEAYNRAALDIDMAPILSILLA